MYGWRLICNGGNDLKFTFIFWNALTMEIVLCVFWYFCKTVWFPISKCVNDIIFFPPGSKSSSLLYLKRNCEHNLNKMGYCAYIIIWHIPFFVYFVHSIKPWN